MNETESIDAFVSAVSNYLCTILKGIVAQKDAVRVESRKDEQGLLLTAHVHPDDLRYTIGKGGETAESIRKILRRFRGRADLRISVRIHESPEQLSLHMAEKARMAPISEEAAPMTTSMADEKIPKASLDSLQTLEQKLGVEFRDKQMLITALTHRSYLNEDPTAKEHNERLEFLGDAVLELAVTDHLYRKFRDCNEGQLTLRRSVIVKGENLLAVGEHLGIIGCMRMSKGERCDVDSGGKSREWIIANAMEALIGAVYLDLGLGEAKLFIDAHILRGSTASLQAHREWKSELQELVQVRFGYTPHYRTLASSGPDHKKHFRIGLFVGETQISSGEGTSKPAAQTAAAKHALENIESWQNQITPKRKRGAQ